jgi:hypothetical protein
MRHRPFCLIQISLSLSREDFATLYPGPPSGPGIVDRIHLQHRYLLAKADRSRVLCPQCSLPDGTGSFIIRPNTPQIRPGKMATQDDQRCCNRWMIWAKHLFRDRQRRFIPSLRGLLINLGAPDTRQTFGNPDVDRREQCLANGESLPVPVARLIQLHLRHGKLPTFKCQISIGQIGYSQVVSRKRQGAIKQGRGISRLPTHRGCPCNDLQEADEIGMC